ncbi:MAG: hypothetical protein WCP30_04430 [Mycobacteriaceae bacterium]
MFETTPPQPAPDSFDPEMLADDLIDPVGGVVAVELSRRFVRLCLSWSEPMVADLAAQETVLRQPGGADLAERMLAQRLYQRIDPQVFRLLRVCVPLTHAEFTLSRTEELLRAKFGEVVRTMVSYLLSHDRDTAIQMGAVATTMAGREVSAAVAAIVADTRLAGDDD